MYRLPVLLLLFCPCLAFAQTASQPEPQSAPQVSPQAAYDQAVRPLDITRRAAQNWSEIELDALAVATDQAKASCSARNPGQYTGEDLLAYAHLCAFARRWQPVLIAAKKYLDAQREAPPETKLTGFPNLSEAFDYEIQANIQLKSYVDALLNARTMLETVPYDVYASEATDSTIRYSQLIDASDTFELLAQRQPILLSLLKANAASNPAATSSPNPPLPIHILYAEAIALPAMQQFMNQPKSAATSFAALEAALPANLSSEDVDLIAESRRQYLLLGSPLPGIHASASLLDHSFAAPQDLDTNFGAATVFVLFQDWCAQCITSALHFGTAATNLKQQNSAVRLYGLLAQADPKPPAPKAPPKPAIKPTLSGDSKTLHQDIQLAIKPTAAALLVGTPTLLVPVETINTFVATDFPLVVVTDHNGIVRFIQPADENAIIPGGLIEQVVAHVLQRWPPSAPK
ncbi:hypothetical protein [Granulicella sp. S156]|uniref:hypothetical protein n=1 Tax=Granulicella sp. S156 TaxID=1747224 RepID=UPI00131E1338|nr:hypothetical protein [Granulicella sp. S156]